MELMFKQGQQKQVNLHIPKIIQTAITSTTGKTKGPQMRNRSSLLCSKWQSWKNSEEMVFKLEPKRGGIFNHSKNSPGRG